VSKRHKHFVTKIETKTPDIFGGDRVAVFHSREEARDDLVEWLNEELCESWSRSDWMVAIVAYGQRTGRRADIEEH
jgi:hypothetical protein